MLHTAKHQHDISKSNTFILSVYISSSKECFVFILSESENDRKKSTCGQPYTHAFLCLPYHLSTNKTEEAESYYKNKINY